MTEGGLWKTSANPKSLFSMLPEIKVSDLARGQGVQAQTAKQRQ